MRVLWTISVLCFTASMATANPITFESGSLAGWTIDHPRVLTLQPTDSPADMADLPAEYAASGASQLYWRPAGIAEVIQPTGAVHPTAFASVDGTSVAAIGTGNASRFFIDTKPIEISASRAFTLEAGNTIAGSSLFWNGDYVAQDSAWVRIIDAAGAIIAEPWAQYSGSGSLPYSSYTAWTPWIWEAPTVGVYTLMLGATTFGDDRFASIGYHDGIQSVPEPSTLVLIVTGAGLLIRRQRQRRRSKA